jgi:cell division inhibitor SepF
MPGMWQKTMVYLGLKDDDEGYEYDYDELDLAEAEFADAEPVASMERPLKPARPVRREPAAPAVRVQPRVRAVPVDDGDLAPIPTIRAMPATSARVHVVEPQGFNDAQEVGDRLKSDQPVIINLQGLGKDLQRRLIDFSSGLTYAIGGSMARVADQVFLLTPSNVEVSQEEKDRLQARGLFGV